MVDEMRRLRHGMGYLAAIFCVGWTVHNSPVVAEEKPETGENQKAVAREVFDLLAGTWKASVDGKFGKATGVRKYEFILKDLYLLSKHESIHLPDEDYPDADHHADMGIYSYDKARDAIVFRQFFGEGVVIQYICDFGERRFDCISENSESNDGTQVQARFSLEIVDGARLREVYELGFDGQDLEIYFETNLIRSVALGD